MKEKADPIQVYKEIIGELKAKIAQLENKEMTENKKSRWFRNCNMEELLEQSIKKDWNVETMTFWCLFKQAQFLEKIAYEGLPKCKE